MKNKDKKQRAGRAKPPPPTPKEPKPWDIPPLPARSDEKSETTFAAVGRALTTWELFENFTAKLFGAFVGADDTNVIPATRAYGAVVTFRARVEMVGAAAEAFFQEFQNPELESQTEDLLNRAKHFSARRNEIAHGVVIPAIWLPKGHDRGFALYPSPYATPKYKTAKFDHAFVPVGRRPSYVYTSVEIGTFMGQFGDLHTQTARVWRGVVVLRREKRQGNRARLRTASLSPDV